MTDLVPGYAHPYRRGRYDGNLPDDAPVEPRIWYGIHPFHYGTIFRIIMIWWAGERSDDQGAVSS